MKMIDINNIEEFSAVVCLNGDLPSNYLFDKFSKIPIISADGAAAKLLDMDITPSLIIGDMDSFSVTKYFDTFPKEKIIELPDQETNDFEKILNYCEYNNLNTLLILGFHGGDLEHTLNNWSVFKKYSNTLNLYIVDKNRLAFSVSDTIEIRCRIGELISLIPQTSATITTKNLKWNLDNETLEIGVREGARNIAIGEIVSIEVHTGQLLIFIDSI